MILGRSRLLVALLVVYPIAIALLIGLAISRGPAKPTVAIVDETPPGQTIEVGGQRVPVSRYADQLLGPGAVGRTCRRARRRSPRCSLAGALAAVVIPRDIVARIESGFRQGSLEVLYNGDALEQCRGALGARTRRSPRQTSASPNRSSAPHRRRSAALLGRRQPGALGGPASLVGLRRVPATLQAIIARQPPGARPRARCERIERLARFAAQNLRLADATCSRRSASRFRSPASCCRVGARR